jgi:glycosyltransferase involved in cell wall biosynthesis
MRIRVLHITQCFGGVETSIRTIISSIDPENFESVVCCPDPNISFSDRNGISIKVIPIHLDRTINPWVDGRAFLFLIHIIRKIKPDIIHCHSSKAGIIGRLAGWFCGTPTAFTPQAFSFLSGTRPLVRKIYRMIERCSVPFTELVIASSESEQKLAIKEVGIPEAKTVVFKNCIIPNTFKRQSVDSIRQTKTFCVVGRPSYQKNIEMVVRVASLLRNEGMLDVRFVILGAGHHSPEKERIQEMIKDVHLQDIIIMHDWVDHDVVLSAIGDATAVLLTSRYEGLPYAAIEAMSLGRIVIATDVYGTRDCVVHEKTGFLVPLDGDREMGDRIRQVLDDGDLRKRMEAEALIEFDKKYNVEKKIGELEQIYKKMVEKRKSKYNEIPF